MKLHIGCRGQHLEGFKRVDIVDRGDVDILADAKSLPMVETDSVDEIYASHILEHIKKTETVNALKEWNRILNPGGVLWVAVPDFDRLVDIYLKSGRVMSTWLSHIINGDQLENEAFHYANFNYGTLSGYLSIAGFSKMERVEMFPYRIPDASTITDSLFNIPISLNIKATK